MIGMVGDGKRQQWELRVGPLHIYRGNWRLQLKTSAAWRVWFHVGPFYGGLPRKAAMGRAE